MKWVVAVGFAIAVLVLVALFLPLSGNRELKENTINRSLRVQQPTELWNYTCGPIEDIAISEDGKFIAVINGTGYLYLFDNYGNLLWTKYVGSLGSTGSTQVVISADGTYIFVLTSHQMEIMEWQYLTRAVHFGKVSM